MTDLPETVDDQVALYIHVRDKLKKMDEAHEEKRKPLRNLQEKLAGSCQEFLEKAGSTAIKTKHGTVYLSTRYSASLADPEAFMNFVLQTERYELLDRRANSTAVKDYVTEFKTLPPGANLSALKTVGVRRA